jgi:hypothetical protein
MPEHVLHDFQVGASGEGETCGAVAKVMQPDRRQSRAIPQRVEVSVSQSRAVGSPFGRVIM